MSIKEKVVKLINVKSIVTLDFTVVFCILAATGAISSTAFLSIFTTSLDDFIFYIPILYILVPPVTEGKYGIDI